MKKVLAMCIVLSATIMLNQGAWADDLAVGPGKKVTLDYTLTVDNKQVDTSVGKAPLTYVAGARMIIPGLEAQMKGMHKNEEKVITVLPKDAYGEIDPKAFRDFPVTSLPKDMELKVGTRLLATAPNGAKFPAEISAVKGDQVTVDFNSPMAGKTLVFKVKVLNIENASAVSAVASAPVQ